MVKFTTEVNGKKYDMLDPAESEASVNDFMNDLIGQIMDTVKEHPNQCTNCTETVYLNPGKNICPHCQEELNLTVDITN